MRTTPVVVLLLASLAVYAADTARPGIVVNPTTDRIVPQVVDGGDGWSTSFFLTSLEATGPIFWEIRFFGNGGLPLTLPIQGVGIAQRLFASLPPNWSVTIDTTGGSPVLQEGWAVVTTYDRSADQPGAAVISARIAGLATFRQRVAGRPDFEAVVPFSPANETRLVMPFDNRAGFSTGIAWLNPDPSNAAPVQVTILRPDATLLGTEAFNIGPGAKLVFSMPARYPQAAGQQGRILVETTGRLFSALGLRFNPGGAFTSFHALSSP